MEIPPSSCDRAFGQHGLTPLRTSLTQALQRDRSLHAHLAILTFFALNVANACRKRRGKGAEGAPGHSPTQHTHTARHTPRRSFKFIIFISFGSGVRGDEGDERLHEPECLRARTGKEEEGHSGARACRRHPEFSEQTTRISLANKNCARR
jgi:hypothetical protein